MDGIINLWLLLIQKKRGQHTEQKVRLDRVNLGKHVSANRMSRFQKRNALQLHKPKKQDLNMKNFIKYNSISILLIFSLFFGAFGVWKVYAASVTAAFPAALNAFSEGDTIEEEDWAALEETIGITGSAVTTSHDFLIKSASSSLYTLAKTDGGFVVGDGTNYVIETGSTARTSLSLGTGDSPTFTGLTLTNDLTVANGGTGASTLTGILIGNGTSAFTATSSLASNNIDDVYLFNNADDTTSGKLTIGGGFISQASSTINSTLNVIGDLTINDNSALELGTDQDSRIYYDGTDTFWDLRAIGTGDLMIALEGSFPSPDPGAVHIWKGSAGTISADSLSSLIIEENGRAILQFLVPNNERSDIFFGSPANVFQGFISYLGSTDTPADTMMFGTAASERLHYSANAFAFQEVTTISTTAGALTLSPNTNTVLSTGFISQASSTISSTLNTTGIITMAGFVSQASSTQIGDLQFDGDLDFVGAGTITTTSGNLNLIPAGEVSIQSTVYILEQADAAGDFDGYGQIWVDNLNPNIFMFTDDLGTDFIIAHDATTALSSLVTVSALDSGSITSGFGNIDTGSSNLDVDGTVTMNGTINFGGATSFETVNGTSCTVDTTGELCVDTTADQFLYMGGTTLQVLSATTSKALFLFSPAVGDDVRWTAPYDLTLQEVRCLVDPEDTTGKSVTMDIWEGNSSGDSTTTIFYAEGVLICGNTNTATTTFTNATIDSGDKIGFTVESASGTITGLDLTLIFFKDRK